MKEKIEKRKQKKKRKENQPPPLYSILDKN